MKDKSNLKPLTDARSLRETTNFSENELNEALLPVFNPSYPDF